MNANERICANLRGWESCASRGLARDALGNADLIQSTFRDVKAVVTPCFRGLHPFFVSLRCLEGHPLEDVSLCGVLRCVGGGYGRCGYVVCCLVSGLLFWRSDRAGLGGLSGVGPSV